MTAYGCDTHGVWAERAALLLTLLVPLSGCGLCADHVLDRFQAPDSSAELVVFERNCGATTDFSTQASIGEINAGTGNQAGNIFIADTNRGAAPVVKRGGLELRVRWIDNRTIELAHHRSARVFEARNEYRGITIRYVTFE